MHIRFLLSQVKTAVKVSFRLFKDSNNDIYHLPVNLKTEMTVT